MVVISLEVVVVGVSGVGVSGVVVVVVPWMAVVVGGVQSGSVTSHGSQPGSHGCAGSVVVVGSQGSVVVVVLPGFSHGG